MKILIIADVDKDALENVKEMGLNDAIRTEIGWMEGNGVAVENWQVASDEEVKMLGEDDVARVAAARDIICGYCNSDYCENCDVLRVVEEINEENAEE